MADAANNSKDTETPVLSIDEARPALGDLVARADYAGGRTVITRYGKEAAAIVSMKDLERLRELDAA